jgi:hypothetical protein
MSTARALDFQEWTSDSQWTSTQSSVALSETFARDDPNGVRIGAARSSMDEVEFVIMLCTIERIDVGGSDIVVIHHFQSYHYVMTENAEISAELYRAKQTIARQVCCP